jgi:rhamnosyltransferase
MHRLALFHIFENDGTIKKYEEYLLKEIISVSTDVITIVNGTLDEPSKEKILGTSSHLYLRENKGFDAMAYKEILVGLNLTIYDEVFLINNSCFGPLYPLGEIFDRMAAKPCDFWGLLERTKNKRPYLQSNFLVFRQSVVGSGSLENFFASMPYLERYSDVLQHFEFKITQWLCAKGFQSAAFFDNDLFRDRSEYINLTYAYELTTMGFPFIKKAAFALASNYIQYRENDKTNIQKLLEHLEQLDSFHPNMITEIFPEATTRAYPLKALGTKRFIYGAGVIGISLQRYFATKDMEISGFIVTDEICEETKNKIPIYSLAKWISTFKDDQDTTIILGLSSIHQSQVIALLENNGCSAHL